MYFIYKLKIPFFERYRVNEVMKIALIICKDTLALGEKPRKMENQEKISFQELDHKFDHRHSFVYH